jgi:NAD(P)-dependent dehydrogenase (short-subunit alcohol dehydrogenase family)
LPKICHLSFKESGAFTMKQLEGRRIIITGAGSGIGLAITQRFLTEGAKVVAVVRRQEAVKDLPQNNENLEVVVGDVTDYETNAIAVSTAIKLFGGLDVFIANAGRWDFYKRLQSLSPEQLSEGFDQIFSVNLKSAFLAAHAALSALKKSKGSFIVTGSNASFRPGGGGAIYTASKYALRGMVAQLALELAPDIRVNGVAPGATNTPLSGSDALGQNNKQMNESEEKLASIGQHIPLRRVSEPEEHTDLYVLLAGQSATYITGSILVSDGGLSAGQ